MRKFLNRHGFKLVIFWVIILGLAYATLSILRHLHFQSGAFDLGLYDQAVWQYSRLLIPYNTIKDRLILGDHLTLTLPLLAPLYWLWNDVKALLIFQAFWVSASTIAVFKLCRLRKFSALISLCLSFVYSLFFGIQFAVFFDFRPVVIGVGLIAWLAYFLESRQKKLFWIILILLLLTQENMGLALVGLGLIYFFQKQFRWLAIGFILGGLAWSLLASQIIDLFSPVGFQYWPEINLEPVSLATSFFDSQEKRLTWLYALSWFSFLPIFSPGAMLAVILDLAQYFATGPEFARMWSPFMHHRAILGPFLLLGTLEVLSKLKKKKSWANKIPIIAIILVISALTQQYIFHFALNKLSKPIYWQSQTWMQDNHQLLSLVPPSASVASQQNLVPHLSHRREIYLVWPREHDFEKPYPCGQKSCWWLDFGGQPDYLVVDTRPHQWLTQVLETNENFQAAIQSMENAKKITLEKQVNFAKLYRINH